MHGIWGALAEAQAAAMAASGVANAVYFARRAGRSAGARQLAALALVLLFAGVALEGIAHLGGMDGAQVAAARRVPLLAATLTVSALLWLGARR